MPLAKEKTIQSRSVDEIEREYRLHKASEKMYEAITDLLEIGKRDLSNPKYDVYFEALWAAKDRADGKS